MNPYRPITEFSAPPTFADMADLLPPDSAARVLQNDAAISLADAEAAWREHVDNQDAWRTLCVQMGV